MRRIHLLFIAGLLTAGACERNNRDYAAVKQAGEAVPGSEVHPNVALTPGLTVVREVLPQGDEGVNGQALYNANCAACHQVTGAGIPGVFPPLVKSPYVIGDNTERLAAIMVYGLKGPINVLGTTYNNMMTPMGALKNEELAAVATYIRSNWGNSAAAVDANTFQKVRDKYGSRGQFEIKELGEEK